MNITQRWGGLSELTLMPELEPLGFDFGRTLTMITSCSGGLNPVGPIMERHAASTGSKVASNVDLLLFSLAADMICLAIASVLASGPSEGLGSKRGVPPTAVNAILTMEARLARERGARATREPTTS